MLNISIAAIYIFYIIKFKKINFLNSFKDSVKRLQKRDKVIELYYLMKEKVLRINYLI